jgi:hypothetical protein
VSLLDDVRGLLEEAGIRYAIVGAAAMAYRGVSRATLDVDLLTMDARILAVPLWEPLSSADTDVDVRVGDADDPLRAVVRLERPGDREVDVILGKAEWQRDIVDRAELLGSPGRQVPVVRVADLILLKLYAGSPQDAWDVHQLLGDSPDPEIVADVDRLLAALPSEARQLWLRVQGV